MGSSGQADNGLSRSKGSEAQLDNTIRRRRDRLGLSQQALAESAGVSRQAIIAVERGRRVPSTSLALRLARALRCGVDDLFSLGPADRLTVRLAPPSAGSAPAAGRAAGARVAVGEVGGRWVAHRLPADPAIAADGLVAAGISGRTALVRPLVDPDQLRNNVIVSGCAPLLGSLAHRVGQRFAGVRAAWIPGSSQRSLDLLEAGLVHVAGVHGSGEGSREDNIEAVRRCFPGEHMVVVNLTRWRQGLVVPPGNPLAIRTVAGLLRPGLRFARRETGAGAHRLLVSLLDREGAERPVLPGPFAEGHVEVAQLVRCGAADVGIAIEGVALAAGLDFVALAEERFDLVIPLELAESPPVSRLIETLEDPSFVADMRSLPGYDGGLCGHVTTLEAA